MALNRFFKKPDTGHEYLPPFGTQNFNSGNLANEAAGNSAHLNGATFNGAIYIGADKPPTTLNASLSFTEMSSRYYSIISATEHSTCEWLSQNESFIMWERHGGILLIKGKPGSGKSTLLRYALDQRKHSEGKKGINLSFFFHGRGSSLQKTLLGFYRTVLFQLLEELSRFKEKPEALSKLEDSFKHQCDSRGPLGKSSHWETPQLAQEFQFALAEVLKNSPVYLYVDALDECGEEEARRLAESFEKMVQTFPDKKLYVCVSCRHYPLLTVNGAFQICVEQDNESDIKTYVRSQTSLFPSTAIPDMIIKRSAGVFMWACLEVEHVKTLYSKGVSEKEIEDSLPEIPRGLEELYEDLFRNMLGNENSLRLVRWICFAKRPLSLVELRWAMFVEAHPEVKSLRDCRSARDFPCDCCSECTCEVMERRVKSLGHGFVDIVEIEITGTKTKTVKFIHPSVQEFFRDKNALTRLHDSVSGPTRGLDYVIGKTNNGQANNPIAHTCVRYCNMEEVKEVIDALETNDDDTATLRTNGDALGERFPFLHYAATSWKKHANEPRSSAYTPSPKESAVLRSLSHVFPDSTGEQHVTQNERRGWLANMFPHNA